MWRTTDRTMKALGAFLLLATPAAAFLGRGSVVNRIVLPSASRVAFPSAARCVPRPVVVQQAPQNTADTAGVKRSRVRRFTVGAAAALLPMLVVVPRAFAVLHIPDPLPGLALVEADLGQKKLQLFIFMLKWVPFTKQVYVFSLSYPHLFFRMWFTAFLVALQFRKFWLWENIFDFRYGQQLIAKDDALEQRRRELEQENVIGPPPEPTDDEDD